MTKNTKRDKIWDAGLRCGERGVFDVEECLFVAGLDERTRRTAIDTLDTMVELGQLNRIDYLYRRNRPLWIRPGVERVEKESATGGTSMKLPRAFE